MPVLAALLIVARIVSLQFPETSHEDLVHWVPMRVAPLRAAMEHKKILFEFSAEWCGPCHTLEQEVFFDPKLAAMINDKFIPVKVIDRQREEGSNPPDVQRLQTRFGVQAFPTIVLAGVDGKVNAKVVGYEGRSRFEEFLSRQ